jgi:alkanesulfonate monooxygenase SsuD/methylene tetrahydromethanopterin reductase-like flavin-dependent oxidoreductase (luciferase family)
MVNLGLMFSFRNPPEWALPMEDVYRSEFRLIEAAEALGYDTIWLTEHHFAEDGYSPSLVPLAGAIAARTDRVRIGTNLLLLPLYHPVRLAEDFAVLDVMSSGRVDLGVGQGYVGHEFAGFGVPKSERTRRFVESLAIVKGLWSQECFTHHGEFFHVDGARLQPRPVQRPHPPMWVGATSPAAVERAGRMGFNLLGLSNRRLQETYENALTAGGWDPAESSVLQLLWVYVASHDDEAWSMASPHFHHVLATYAKWAADSGDASRMNSTLEVPGVDALRSTDPRRLMFPALFGSPDTVASQIAERLRGLRVTHLCLAMRLPGMPEELCRSSMELFAREVAPKIRELVGTETGDRPAAN